MASLAELGEIAKSAPTLTKKTGFGVFNDLFGRKTMANRRVRLKEAEAHLKANPKSSAAQQATDEVQREYNNAVLRRGASLGVGFGGPAAVGYHYGQKKARQSYAPPGGA